MQATATRKYAQRTHPAAIRAALGSCASARCPEKDQPESIEAWLKRLIASLTGNSTSSADATTFIYDQSADCSHGIGRLCSVEDASGSSEHGFDAYGNLTFHKKGELASRYLTRYEYDAADRVSSITYPDGRVVSYIRDSLGRITAVETSVNGTRQVILSGRTYRADGLPLTQTYGNGLIEQRGYDLQGRLLTQTLGSADTRLYAYDANSNLTQKTTLTTTATYTLDALDRLTADRRSTATTAATDRRSGLSRDSTSDSSSNGKDSKDSKGSDSKDNDYDTITVTGASDTYSYDPNANRITQTGRSDPKTYLYQPGSNRLQGINTEMWVLDQSGNTISDQNGKRRYAYDRAGRLKRVYREDEFKAEYTYDYRNLRTRKASADNDDGEYAGYVKGGNAIVYHYDQQGRLINETTASGNSLRAYIWLDDEPVVQIDKRGESESGYNYQSNKERLAYLHPDHLDTPRLATDAKQNVVWKWEGDAFGGSKPAKPQTASTENKSGKESKEKSSADGYNAAPTINLRFPGQYFDKESGLHYNWNRYYDPKIGRYITSDPIGLSGGLNSYVYGGGNPVSFTDVDGLQVRPPRAGGGVQHLFPSIGPTNPSGPYSIPTQGTGPIRSYDYRGGNVGRNTGGTGNAADLFRQFTGGATTFPLGNGNGVRVTLPNGTSVNYREGPNGPRIDIFPPGGSPETLHFPIGGMCLK